MVLRGVIATEEIPVQTLALWIAVEDHFITAVPL
jgi:hypothetical protein